ncbi:phosphoserine phosphatase SerB [Ferrimonas sediminicola]|uniref:Phosphoserine phosphatase n=1 Tax=Ferrimonas sediminicola TaxID=2569538 RepID=A0A4U1BDZ6_9GAMM|nr:phosphoserine phosphatase SerB [Ferrimonas sediminicola]TKB49262.1 phosphoserine phosphatase SerB [Ferrimonas sediminicola]
MSLLPLSDQETRVILTDAAAAGQLADEARRQGLVVSSGLRGVHHWVSWQGQAPLPLPSGAECFRLRAERPRLDRPGLLLMDMDSTAIAIECIDEIARAGGVFDEVSRVTEAAMRGELGFEESLRQRVAKLDGIPASVLDEIAASLPLNPGLEPLVQGLKQAGWKVALASGGFNRIASKLAAQLELDHFQANDLEEAGGLLTGRVSGEIVGAEVKAAILAQLGERYGIPPDQWVAAGDGANDLPMMSRAALGVGFRAKPAVAAEADAHLATLGLDAILALLI